jgi:ABC-2 type transport system permease protein
VIGLAAFVSEETSAYEWIYSKIVFILGGLLIPLDFYPEWLRNIALNLPFAYTLYGPARLFIEPSAERFFSLLGGQLAWIAALGLVVALLYRKSISWLVINGG